MIEWINSKSFEGFTALHLASFRGDLVIFYFFLCKKEKLLSNVQKPIIEELVLNGAKVDELNDQG